MNIILFGPQGSGKGTQAELLEKKLKLYHLSMGEELRKEIKKGTLLGKKLEKIMNKGLLVPTEVTTDIVLKISKLKESRNGIIFDGYPRSDDQWQFLKKAVKIDAAIELSLSDQESVRRISSRRICPKCGRNYNTIYIKPKFAGRCDVDNEKLVQRDDDTPKAVMDRLKIYRGQTEPLKKEYGKLGILHVIDGSQPIKEVSKDIFDALKIKK
ncbi:MAG: adenylate kinase family protein [Candidatus Woesearchaeota archaeon]